MPWLKTQVDMHKHGRSSGLLVCHSSGPDALIPRAREHIAVPHGQHAHVVLMPLQRTKALQGLAVPHLLRKSCLSRR